MIIELLRADITSLKVDAVVNPVSPGSVESGGAVGTAVVTTAGNLLCRFVIHAIVPTLGDGDEERKLRDATLAALQRGEDLAIESIAFPAMGTGAFGLSYEQSARTMIGAARSFAGGARSVRRVIFCLFNKEAYDAFDHVLHKEQS